MHCRLRSIGSFGSCLLVRSNPDSYRDRSMGFWGRPRVLGARRRHKLIRMMTEPKTQTVAGIDAVLHQAQQAFQQYKLFSGKQRAAFLRAIADEIEALGPTLITTVVQETNLPEARITGERGRTTGQCRMFAQYIEEGSWVEARIDTAIPERTPLPRPDLRKMLIPLGPVVVFGASNFPLAFSTAGGDTISALAAGCPVILKGHPAHPQTSLLVAEAIASAMRKTGVPEGTFTHIAGGIEEGQQLVLHPLTKAVAFTGSYQGGKALFDLANRRAEPIPVFSEMGSINPVFLLPGALAKRGAQIAELYAGSITQSVGQFCTNPGLLLGSRGEALENFAERLGTLIRKVAPGAMLHKGIASNFKAKREEALRQPGVTLIAAADAEGALHEGRPAVARVALEDFTANHVLAEEVFGPYSLLVQGNTIAQLEQVLDRLPGQLTATVMAEEDELADYRGFFDRLRERVGRLIINGVPTGVEVCPAMHHGGPFPATTDARFTSVGTDAIKRFVRPICFQNYPQALLPDELKDANSLGILRLVNSSWQR